MVKADFLPAARAMMQEVGNAPELLPSKFWEDLNKINLRMLSQDGLERFKRTVSQNYFNWLISSQDHPFYSYLKAKTGKSRIARSIISAERQIEVRLTTQDEAI